MTHVLCKLNYLSTSGLKNKLSVNINHNVAYSYVYLFTCLVICGVKVCNIL